MIAILNYGSGNIKAFLNIYKSLGIEAKVVSELNDLHGVSKIIMPGVGSFDKVMLKLRSASFFNLLEHLVLNERMPILGVCVGMQIMALKSQEGNEKGLGWIGGEVLHLNKLNCSMQTPHMGWNQVGHPIQDKIFIGIDNSADFYFLHSFFFQPQNKSESIATCTNQENFCVAVKRGNIYGVQFHPEKSHHSGIRLLKNFATL
jgi:glutamine amidotransferase